jgi:DNA-binding NarL/FixJ family response regulator
LEILARCYAELGRRDDAARAVATAEARAAELGVPTAACWAHRAAAAVALKAGDLPTAVERALASVAAAEQAGAVVEAATSRALAGQALARAGDVDAAVHELERAAAAFEEFGAVRYRDATERELRKLGRHTHRRTRTGTTDGTGLESLSERELEVARLVVDRKTNREIAADLFLSLKTVESHMRSLFRKLDVTSRVEVARIVERADREGERLPSV